MSVQSFGLAYGVATLLFEYAVDLALTGDPDQAIEAVSTRHEIERDSQEDFENLFWD